MTTIYAPGFDRARIASLAPDVLAACSQAPELGERLLAPAGAELAEIVGAVARSLGWSSGPLPLAMAGGFLLSATIVRQGMIDNLGRQGYQVDVSSRRRTCTRCNHPGRASISRSPRDRRRSINHFVRRHLR